MENFDGLVKKQMKNDIVVYSLLGLAVIGGIVLVRILIGWNKTISETEEYLEKK